jgi:hypothetical protein
MNGLTSTNYEEAHNPINWQDEARVDLPPRTPARIAFLLKFETPAQTAARIDNDRARFRIQRGSSFSATPQTAIIPVGAKYSGKAQFVKR